MCEGQRAGAGHRFTWSGSVKFYALSHHTLIPNTLSNGPPPDEDAIRNTPHPQMLNPHAQDTRIYAPDKEPLC